jgi:Spy/CpxP family protein refolding chaperone
LRRTVLAVLSSEDKQGPRRCFLAGRIWRWEMRSLFMVLTAAALLLLPVKLSSQREVGGLVEKVQDLNLTDDQEAKIMEIRKECTPEVQKAVRQLATTAKEEVEKIHALLTPDQREKLKTFREERTELRADRLPERIAHLKELDLTEAEKTKIEEIRNEFHPKFVAALEGLKGTLNPEQTTAREQGLKAGMKRKEVLATLKLTGEQKEKVEAVGKQLRPLVQDEMEKIRDVLSEGQKEKLDEFKTERREHVRDHMAYRIANFKELNLSDEQKSQIAEIRKEYRPRVHEAGNVLRGTVREELERVIAVMKQ